MTTEPTADTPTGPDPAMTGPKLLARMLRAAGLAFDLRKLILAALGLLLTSLGWWAIDRAFGQPAAWPRVRAVGPVGPILPDTIATLARATAEPILRLAGPFSTMFNPSAGALSVFRAFLATVWGVGVWGLVGGAIARIAVVELAGGTRPGLVAALRFAVGRAGALIGAPLSPLLGVSLFAMLCAGLGLIYRLGPVGETVAGGLAFLPMLAGLVMVLLLVGLALGWPLMVLTVATEGEDVFDALSRSYSYVMQRPAKYLGLVLLAWAIGSVALMAVWFLADLVLRMSVWGLTIGGPRDRVLDLFHPLRHEAQGAAGTVHAFWVDVLEYLAAGWVDAYFWSAAAMIYLLMRREVDGAAFDDVYQVEHDDDRFAPDLEPVGPKLPPPDPTAGAGPEGDGS